MKPVSTILREAKALIDAPEKWGQDKSAAGTAIGTLCIATAISERRPRNEDFAQECDGAYRAICAAIGIEFTTEACIWRWNDAPNRTHAEVMAAFDKAIALAEAEEANHEH